MIIPNKFEIIKIKLNELMHRKEYVVLYEDFNKTKEEINELNEQNEEVIKNKDIIKQIKTELKK